MRRGLILARAPREWNVRVLTQDDFYTYCDTEQITVEEIEYDQCGLYVICDDQPHIIINQCLRGAEKLFVCFHELAHFWLHPPGIQHFHRMRSIAETEADVVAACAMIPITVFNHYLPSEILDLHGYPDDLVELRREVFDRYKI